MRQKRKKKRKGVWEGRKIKIKWREGGQENNNKNIYNIQKREKKPE